MICRETCSTMSQFDRGKHQIFEELAGIVSENEELKLQLCLLKHKLDVTLSRVPHRVLKIKTISWRIADFVNNDSFFYTSERFSFGDFTFSLFLGFHELAYKANYGFLLVLENGIHNVKHIDLIAKFCLCHPFGAHYTKYRGEPLRFYPGDVSVRGIHTFIDKNWIQSYLTTDGAIQLEVTLSDLKITTVDDKDQLSMMEYVRSSEISDPYDV